MAKVFECKITKTVTVNIKADSAEAVKEWLVIHDLSEVEELTSMYEVEYDDIITGEVNEEYAIDITN